ncbi:lipoprotein [Wielerella bovis]|nr:lipoprotein [Wielerella bovis]MCG7657852.1 lipoprotein [Wielerella bovis]MCG7660074.1 lipoprotein [Wielerella bovis]ULJ60091.1 lipoprotein [Wielerella bovis]ULJ69028.1 lipoprotein [Wielerella bovis]
MKKILLTLTLIATLSGCAHTHTHINANNGGVWGSIGQSYRW